MTIFVIVGVVIVYSFLPCILSNFPRAKLGSAVFADVTSANVVGYQGKGLGVGKNYICQTLQTVASELAGQKLSAWVPNADFAPLADSVTFWNSLGNIDGQFGYIDQATIDAYGGMMSWGPDVVPGWYLYSECQMWQPTKPVDYTIPYGKMGFVMASRATANITFAGEVRRGTTLVLGVGKNYVGNCSPVDIDLQEMKPNALFAPLVDSVTLWNSQGNIEGQFGYIDQATIDAYGGMMSWGPDVVPGWYLYSECQMWQPTKPVQDVTIVAGRAFFAMASNAEAAFEIPDPIGEAK